jgi:hypothetical protein
LTLVGKREIFTLKRDELVGVGLLPIYSSVYSMFGSLKIDFFSTSKYEDFCYS